MVESTVIFEPGESNWPAYDPDLPGCVAAAVTREEAEDLIPEAIALHIARLREDGEIVPEPPSEAARIAVAA